MKGNDRNSGYERDADDWYVEHPSVVLVLCDVLADYMLLGGFHDPCCGGGTIPDTLRAAGFSATGADLVDRANGRFPVRDFLADQRRYDSIITNPPFRIAADIVRHALGLIAPGGIVAIIAQAKFVYSQGRYPLFQRPEMDCVIHLSRRPSMPPGRLLAERGEACRGGGSMDYCWLVWRRGRVPGPVTTQWVL